LNNPLNNIFISAQALQKETGEGCSPFVKEAAQDIFGQTMRVKGIVGDLLEFAREKTPQMKSVEIISIIKEAYELIGKITNVSKVDFTIDAPGEEVSIEVDPEQMERVFMNLFSNAVDAMKKQGKVTVRVSREEGMIRITVSDTGAGISREDMDNIFDPFFTTRERGTGLGLAIVFNIIKKHGGRITVESEKGKGTDFTITLPEGGV
jgi:two-component system NtrC family sensor kinase